MHTAQPPKAPERKDDRTIIHIDYDCFYASVVEHETPALKTRPLAIQQKQIIVTCNYEARRRGLYKLQLIAEAKKICPDVAIVLGEDLTRFRDASKALYAFLRRYAWNGRAERLGFDEVWLDVSDVVEYNLGLLNRRALAASFFQLARDDPTAGFAFDATHFAGHVVPETAPQPLDVSSQPSTEQTQTLRLLLASHLSLHLRQTLASEKGYTATAGIATNKLLSKLVGNQHKPNAQTTLLPPYTHTATAFLDPHDIGAIPGIGFKLAQKLRAHVLARPARFRAGLVYGASLERVTVASLRCSPDTTPALLETLLAGPGAPRGIGARVWGLLHGVDDAPVAPARDVPRQISLEDSYVRLDTLAQVTAELDALALRLLERMRLDLTTTTAATRPTQTWLAKPTTLRLSTRPRPPLQADGTRPRTFARISRSAPLPSFALNLHQPPAELAPRLVASALLPLFRRLHPQRAGWNLSLMNVAVTDMQLVAAEGTAAAGVVGRDIVGMFRGQGKVREAFSVRGDDRDSDGDGDGDVEPAVDSPHDPLTASADHDDDDDNEEGWHSASESESEPDAAPEPGSAADDRDPPPSFLCALCAATIPTFARAAHERFHAQSSG